MLFSFLVAFGLPILSGFLLTTVMTGGSLVFRLSLGTGLGLGLTSLITYPFLISSGLKDSSFIWIELALAIILAFWYFRGRKETYHPPTRSWTSQDYLLTGLLGLTLLMVGYIFLRHSLHYPHGEWDAWDKWNTLPRFIFRGIDHWRDRHSYAANLEAHPFDYPLLMTLMVARVWRLIGSDQVLVPILIAPLFTLAAIGLLWSSLAEGRGPSQASLATALLAGTPMYINIATAQYADIPLGFFFLAGVVLLYRVEEQGATSIGAFILAGLAAGMAAWTKNEGLLFLAVIISAWLVINIIKGKGRWMLGRAPYILLGLLPVLIIILHFKLNIAQTSHFLRATPAEMFNRIFDLPRHLTVFSAMLTVMGPLPALAIYMLLLGARLRVLKDSGVLTGLLALALLLAGDYLVLVCLLPDNWPPGSASQSWDRLILQPWPAFLFLFFLVVAEPELKIRAENRRRHDLEVSQG